MLSFFKYCEKYILDFEENCSFGKKKFKQRNSILWTNQTVYYRTLSVISINKKILYIKSKANQTVCSYFGFDGWGHSVKVYLVFFT